jgi:hypothetical protein
MEHIAGWVAPIATTAAAMMTAANLGARVTGWGFVVFTVGSVAWSLVAVATGQQNLLWANGFLTLVNGVGVWRWLGRQARYEAGGSTATKRSAAARVPDLFAVGALAGAKVTGRNGENLGTIVEGMMRCSGAMLAYVVVSEGGMGGVGERLHAVSPAELRFSEDGVTSDLSLEALQAMPVIDQERWPMSVA